MSEVAQYVTVARYRGWFDVEPVRDLVEWREGLCVRDVVEEVGSEVVQVQVAGVVAGPDDPVRAGAAVRVYYAPREPITATAALLFVAKVILATAISFGLSLLISRPKRPKQIAAEDKPSESFSFGAARTLYTGDDVPLPLIYGERSVGGIVIGQFVETGGGPGGPFAVLNLLLALCSGPVQSVAGLTEDSDEIDAATLPTTVRIDDVPIAQYQGATVSVRLGTPDQEPIRGVPSASFEAFVGLPLENEHVDSGNPAVTDWSNAVEYDMEEDGDFAQVLIGFPEGLFESGGATLQPVEVGFEYRYRELDAFGTPFGPWVPGDPLGASFSVDRKVTSDFAEGFTFRFFDPALGPGTIPPGSAIELHREFSGPTGAFLDEDGANTWPWSGAVGSFSIETWVKLGVVEDQGFNSALMSATDEFPNIGGDAVLHDPDGSVFGAAAFKGFVLYARPSPQGGQFRRIGFLWGDGSGVGRGVGWDSVDSELDLACMPNNPNIGDTDWTLTEPVHICATFQSDFDGQGTHRVRVFVNGIFSAEKLTTIDFEWPATADLYESPVSTNRGPFVMGTVNGAQAFAIHCAEALIDRTVVYSRVLTPSEAYLKYAGGLGVAPSLAEDSAIEALYEMEPSTFVSSTLFDLSPNARNLNAYGHGFVAPAPAFNLEIETPGVIGNPLLTGTPKRGRYRIQVQRVTLEAGSDNLNDRAELRSVTIFSDTVFSHPGIALLALRVPAQEQLQGSRPNLSIPVQGRNDVPIWDGQDEENPTYTTGYTRNNAWIALHMLTSDATGLGTFHSLNRTPVLSTFAAWAAFCDELVSDQRPTFFPQPFAGTILMQHQTTVDGPIFRVFVVTTGANYIPTTWRVGDTLQVDGMPAAQTSNGWPTDGTVVELSKIEAGLSLPFFEMKWPSGLAYPPSGPGSINNVANTLNFLRVEPRSECDVVFDQDNLGSWDALKEVFSGGRAAPVRVGDRVRAAFQSPRSPVQMFSDANIIPGTIKVSAVAADEEFSRASMRFHNRDKNWRRDSVPLEDPNASQITPRKPYESSTITRASHALRELRHYLNLNRLRTLSIEFSTSIEAIAVEPGDVVLFSGSLPAFGFAGRLPEGTGSASFRIDRTCRLEAGETYIANIQTSDGSIFRAEILSPAGTYEANDVLSLDSAVSPAARADAHWSIGNLATTGTREMEVAAITLNGDLDATLSLIEYNPDVYDETGFAELPASTGTALDDPTQTQLSQLPAIQALSVEEVSGDDDLGGAPSGVLVTARLGTGAASLATSVVRVWAKVAGTTDAPVPLGDLPPGPAPSALLPLPGVGWGAGTQIAVLAAPVPQGSGQTPGRWDGLSVPGLAREARVVLGGPSPLPRAPGAIQARLAGSGSLALYTLGESSGSGRGRALRGEIRSGGWILGNPVVSLVQGQTSEPTASWLSLPTSAAGKASPRLVARVQHANGAWSAATVDATFQPSAPGTVLAEDSFEDGPWDAVTGDSGSVALSELESYDPGGGDSEALRFTSASTSLTGTWTSPEYDLGSEQTVAVFFGTEAAQVHPMTAGQATASPRGRLLRDWSIEGPLSGFSGLPEEWQGQCSLTLEIAFSSTATPGTNWREYLPGTYTARSFAFRISITRPTTDFNVDVTRGAFRISQTS